MYNGKFLDPSKDKIGFDVWKKHEQNDTLEKPENTWENQLAEEVLVQKYDITLADFKNKLYVNDGGIILDQWDCTKQYTP